MVITTIVPKIGNKEDYIGKPVYNVVKTLIGTITEVLEIDETYELSMTVRGLYSKPDSDEYAMRMGGIEYSKTLVGPNKYE